MARWKTIGLAVITTTLACGESSSGSFEESIGEGTATSVATATTSDCTTPIAAVLVRITDEDGAALGAQVSYSIGGGDFVPAACPMLGQCVVPEGYGELVTVHVEALGCTYESQTNAAADRCSLDAPEVMFVVYPNCTGDPDSSGSGDASSGSSGSGSSGSDSSGSGSSSGDTSTGSSSGDTSSGSSSEGTSSSSGT